jgi:T5SS/PEP-CTERM-associated repeat protein
MNFLRLTLLLTTLTLSFTDAQSQSVWNVVSGNWTNAGNWSPGGVPAGANALIDNSGAATVSSSAPILTPGLLYLGSNTVGNQLLISNGGTLFSSNGILGFTSGSSDNILTVSDPGSVLSVASLAVGNAGPGNQANVLAGGVIRASTNISVGVSATSSNNTLLVNGSGAGVRVGSFQSIVIGDGGAGNRLITTNGGRITNFGTFILGSQAGSSNNTAHLHGTGSLWSAFVSGSGSFVLGGRGSGNQLTVSGGGIMTNYGSATIGAFASASNNTLLVTDTGSVWRMAGFGILGVGSNGVNNQIIISAGGLVTNDYVAYLGDSSSGSNHTVSVSGPGSAWRSGAGITVGLSASHNRLLISDGGAVFAGGNIELGLSSSSTNNLVLLTNSGSSLFVRDNYGLYRGAHRQFDGTATVGSLQFTTSSNLPPFQFVGGVFNVTNLTSINGISPFAIGGGATPALFTAAGANHFFVPTLRVDTNGTFQQRSGSVFLQNPASLVVTNSSSAYELAGGALTLSGVATVSNGQPFSVGNGTNIASLTLPAGLHTFADGLRITSNGTLSGRPTLDCPLTFLSGSTLAPGSAFGAITNRGTTEWNGGMRYDWGISNAIGTPGIGWDFFATSNALAVAASPTNRIVLRLSGNPANFTNGSPYLWTIATAGGGFSGFDVSHVTIDTSALPATNALSAGYFSINTNDNNLNLVFTPLSFTVDTDSDGITDAAELQWAPLGFNWQVSQPALVSNFLATAYNTGLYTTNNIQALFVDTPILTRNTTNGQFTLTLSVEKSSNLLDFVPFPMTSTQTTVNGEGKVEFQFTSPDKASFFRIEAE